MGNNIGEKLDPVFLPKSENKKELSNLSFSEIEDNDSGLGQKIVKLLDQDKTVAGNISFDYPADDDELKMIRVRFCGVHPDYQGQDLSLKLYEHLLKLAKNEGLAGVRSDNTVQAGALASWKKLGDQGYNIGVNPRLQEKYKEFLQAYGEGKYFKEQLTLSPDNNNESVFEIKI